MGDPRRWLRCARCNKEFEFTEVRYLPDRTGVACKQCLGVMDKEHKEQRRQEGKLFGYQCIGCRYMFYRTLQNKPESCPQCGAHDFLKFEKDKLTANTLLRLADDPRLSHLEES